MALNDGVPSREELKGDSPTQDDIKEEVIEALKTVNDPELGIDIINLGLVYDVAVDDDNNVKVEFTLTTMGCPIGPMLDEDIRNSTQYIEGIGDVTTELVMYPPWSPEKMSPLAKSALGFV
ncbi:MAG: metal-sulfur cluster assembly factor [Actinomycetota bacterium]|nr:metal-sulfur cluster assembly factor [Actinomycetota bacterium]